MKVNGTAVKQGIILTMDSNTDSSDFNESETSGLKDVTVRKLPSQIRGKRSVKKIIDACQALLESQGPDQLSTKKIARASGLSTGSLYEYFPNKEAILCAMVESWLSELLDAMDGTSPKHKKFDSVFSWMESCVDSIREVYKGQPIVAKFYNSLMAIPALRHIDKNHDMVAASKFSDCFDHYQLKLNETEKLALARASLFMIHSIITDSVSQEEEVSMELVANLKVALATMFLNRVY